MKTRNGLPFKKDIDALRTKHDLITHHLDIYVATGRIIYGGRHGANEKAAKMVAELQKEGFYVEHRLADPSKGLTGQIHIGRRD